MLEFNEQEHKYTLDGKELISVTQLLVKHNLAPDIKNFVSPEVLKEKSTRGSLLHEEIENYIKTKEEGISPMFEAFKAICEKLNVKPIRSEQRVNNDIVAGTYDLVLRDNETGECYLCDFKTGTSVNLNVVKWQLSLYEYLIGYTFKKLLVLHWNDGMFKIKECDRVDYKEIERLLQCERDGMLYETPKYELQGVESELLAVQEYENALKSLKELEKRCKEAKERIKQVMKENNLHIVENGNVKITYTEYTSTTFDKDKLLQEHPEFATYTKETKSNKLTITVKNND